MHHNMLYMEGALSEDLEVLSKGMMMILPSNEAGQAVLFFDGAPSEILPRNKVVGICFATFLSIKYMDGHYLSGSHFSYYSSSFGLGFTCFVEPLWVLKDIHSTME